ncbi:aconitase family protein [Mycolicibacterium neoaurum]|uniref:aconitase family protein n=1 Tax=Mycolicibacterium neoaurum TaxID=1795 RepID=UPI001F188975|nr:aconitase family protein [Mycolicibacterium neoaurum]
MLEARHPISAIGDLTNRPGHDLDLGVDDHFRLKQCSPAGGSVISVPLENHDLHQRHADRFPLGFNLVGYGCTTCIGNSGPLPADITAALAEGRIAAAAVLSGNRNFEGRINPAVVMNYLASPPLVIAYALAGTMNTDIVTEPLGTAADGRPVYLHDIWPTEQHIADVLAGSVTTDSYRVGYQDLLTGDDRWNALPTPSGGRFAWDPESTFIRRPPFLTDIPPQPDPVSDIRGARVLAKLGDAVTTDHISPAGVIPIDSPAARYLQDCGVAPADMNSYLSRRGNHEVMMRGTFGNSRISNELLNGMRGGHTLDFTRRPAVQTTIFDASRA